MLLPLDLSADPQAEIKVIRIKTDKFTSLMKKEM